MSYKYKSKNGMDYTIPGFGQTVNGEITTTRPFENPNFELVSSDESTANNAHVNGVVPQDQQSATTPAPAQKPESELL